MRFTAFLMCFTFSISLFSQDYLYKKDGCVIPVKEVNSTFKTVSYKIYNDTTNYKYIISVILVDSVVYSSGTVIRYSKIKYDLDKRSLVGMAYPKPNTVFLDFYELVILNNFNIGYEYMFVRPQVGLSCMLTRSVNRETVNVEDMDTPFGVPYSKPEYGLKITSNFYALNTINFNYGIRLINYSIFYNKIKFFHYEFDSDFLIEPAIYNVFGLGVFGLYRFIPSVYGSTALEAYFGNYIYLNLQVSIGFNF